MDKPLHAIVVLLLVSSELSAQPPDARQLLDLVEATEARITSFEFTVESKAYSHRAGEKEPELASVKTVVARRSGEVSFVHESFSWLPESVFPEQADSSVESKSLVDIYHVNLGAYSKTLNKRAGQAGSGIVQQGREVMADETSTPLDIVRILKDQFRDQLAEAGQVSVEADGTLLLALEEAGQPRLRIIVDPQRSYLPVESTLFQDGKPFFEYRVTHAEPTPEGVWLPTHYAATNHVALEDNIVGGEAVFELREFSINPNLNPESLDFAFPTGTSVHDWIAGLAYQVGKLEGGTGTRTDFDTQASIADLAALPAPEQALKIALDDGLKLTSIDPLVFSQATAYAYWKLLLGFALAFMLGAVIRSKLRRRRTPAASATQVEDKEMATPDGAPFGTEPPIFS